MTSDAPAIVIDTNVLISAGILPQSRLAAVLVIAAERFVIAQNEATWNEMLTRIERAKSGIYRYHALATVEGATVAEADLMCTMRKVE